MVAFSYSIILLLLRTMTAIAVYQKPHNILLLYIYTVWLSEYWYDCGLNEIAMRTILKIETLCANREERQQQQQQ